VANTLQDAKRALEVLHIEREHSIAILIGHAGDAKLGFATEPGAPLRPPAPTISPAGSGEWNEWGIEGSVARIAAVHWRRLLRW